MVFRYVIIYSRETESLFLGQFNVGNGVKTQSKKVIESIFAYKKQ